MGKVWLFLMKKIALINDMSGFGKCSLTAAIPVISVLGLQACPLPTAVLSAQTGFPNYYYKDFTDSMNTYTDSWVEMGVSFDGIYSGYLGSAEQIQNVLYFLERFHKEHTIFLADPIMGDNGKSFSIFTPELLSGMRELTKEANVITPNLTELCLLANVDYDSLVSHSHEKDYQERIREAAHNLLWNAHTPQTVIVTGIVRNDPQHTYMGNLAVTADNCFYAETPYTGQSFSGTGDLFASIIIGSLVKGLPVYAAINKAAYFLQPAIEEATKNGTPRNHGIPFEKYLHSLPDA